MKNLTYILLFFSLSIFSQEKVSIAILQDVRLATIGDNRGNEAFTLNILARFKMQGNQHKYGYIVLSPVFEYADLTDKYYRYGVDIGYTFNKLILKDFEATTMLGYGFIERKNISTSSVSGTLEISYKINSFLKIIQTNQLTQRTDLKWMYGDNALRYSNFLGIEININ